MPNHIGAFLKASECFANLGINITRVSYNKAVDSHTLFIDAEGDEEQLKKAEAEHITSNFQNGDTIVLLDEKGKSLNSTQFASSLNKIMLSGCKRVVFVIGGTYGFDNDVYNRANDKISLSPMTFSHQMVRLVFVEQLYRAFTIMKGEPYHHE